MEEEGECGWRYKLVCDMDLEVGEEDELMEGVEEEEDGEWEVEVEEEMEDVS